MAGKQEVTKVEAGGALAEMPDWMKGKQNDVLQGIDQSDMAIPRVALIQSVSDEAQTGEARPGDYFHTLAREGLGKELRMIPIIVTKAYMLWKPRKAGGGILARADDGVHWNPPDAEFSFTLDGKEYRWKTAPTVAESKLDAWGSFDPSNSQSQPAATKMMNMLCWLPDFPHLSPSVFTFQRSSLKPGKKFLGNLGMSQVPGYGRLFKMNSEQATNASGEKYLLPTLVADGFVQDKELFDRLEELNQHFKKVGVKVAEAGLDEEETDGKGPSETEF